MYSQSKPGPLRFAILFVAIFAMLGLSMASTSAQHMHLRSSSGGQTSGGQCDVCVTAHVVSLEAHSLFYPLGIAESFRLVADAEAVAGYQLLLSSSASSRGPPSLA